MCDPDKRIEENESAIPEELELPENKTASTDIVESESTEAEPVAQVESAEQEPELAEAEPVTQGQPDEPESRMDAEPAPKSQQQEMAAEEVPEQQVSRGRSRHPVRNLIWLLLLILLGCYGYGTYYYSSHFRKNTFINGMDVSDLTVDEAEAIFSREAENYSIQLLFRNGESEVISGDSIAYKARLTSRFGDILASQRPARWIKGLWEKTEAAISVRTHYDAALLAESLQNLREMQSENMISPEDAYITYDRTQAAFVIVPETDGTVLDPQAVIEAVGEAINENAAEIDLTADDTIYAKAEVTSENAELLSELETLNKYTTASITFLLPSGETMLLNAEVTKNWLAEDEDGMLYMDEERWKEQIVLYVDEIAANVNTVGKDRSFHATNIGTITVSGGDYGYSVNKVKEIEEIEASLENGDVMEREPYYYQTEYGDDRETNDGIGDTYIEVNLSAQHAWIYKDGVNVCDTDFVSGNTSLGRGTPTGNFQILYKDTDVDLKGQILADGQYSYISHVNYWMPFYNGCGFHDADWRSSFGGTIYRTNGSHGCINLPPSITPTFYSYVEPSMPVIVFY